MSCPIHNNTRIRLASWTAFPLCPYQDSNLRTSTSTWHVVLRRVSSFTCRLRIVRASETEEGFLTTFKPIKSVLFSHPTNVSYSLVFLGVGLITDKRIQTSVILHYGLSASYVTHGWPTVAISALHFFFTATARKPFQEFPTYLMGCLPIIRSFCFVFFNIQTLFQKSKYFSKIFNLR